MDSLSTQSGFQVRHRQLHSRWFAAASASSLLDTSPHLGRQQLFLCYRLHPETPHTHPPPPCPTRATTAAVPVRRAAAPCRARRIIPTQYAVSLPCLLLRSPSRPRDPVPPSRPPALISPIYPSQVRLFAAACCFVSIYRGRLFPTGLSLEERGGGLFEVFEISYRSATPQSAVL